MHILYVECRLREIKEQGFRAAKNRVGIQVKNQPFKSLNTFAFQTYPLLSLQQYLNLCRHCGLNVNCCTYENTWSC